MVLFVSILKKPELGALIGLIFATACIFAIQICCVAGDLLNKVKEVNPSGRDWMMEAKAFARPFLGWTVIGWIQSAAERWSLTGWRDEAAVGIYGAASQLCNAPVTVLSTIVSNYATPRLSGSWDQRYPTSRELWAWVYLAAFGMVSVIGFALTSMIFGHFLIRALLSEHYLGSEKFIPVLIVSSGAFALGQAMTIPLVAINPVLINLPKWGAPLLGAVLAISMVPFWGIWGVAVAALISNCIFVAWLTVLMMGQLSLAKKVEMMS